MEPIEVLINPRMPSEQSERLVGWLHEVPNLPSGHTLILTSGSSASSEADYKWVALSPEAIHASAAAANCHIESDSSDIWLHCLPDFHVGGLGIWARARLSGAKVVCTETPWSPTGFADAATEAKATLASLVPTQVYDLVEGGLKCPSTMRAIVVGGAALGEATYQKARALGWPLLPSYGMTESASQIATASLDSLDSNAFPTLQVLSHLQVETNEEGRLKVRGESMLTGYIHLDQGGKPIFTDPKDVEGWFTTEDFGEIHDRSLSMLGRVSERVKIGGEIVNLAHLRRTLECESKGLQVALTTLPDARLETVIALCAEATVSNEQIARVTIEFNSQVMPYERIRVVRRVEKIPRTELGKVKWSVLAELAQEP